MNIIIISIGFSSCLIQVLCMASCGIDNSPVKVVYEGRADIETYPWLGVLYYPYLNKRLTTAVVLVTRQIVLAAAIEIDKLPKDDFRTNAKVVIGHNCTGPHIGVRDYTYHPDYTRMSYSALAMIQLETDLTDIKLRPICPPPLYFNNPKFYAMVISNDCRKSRIMIHKMKYVSLEACRNYYRRSGLDLNTMWPSHLACARSVTKGKCVWRNGAVLTVKIGNQWSLLGFGIYGPGCQAPARFLDYGMYHKWVARSISRIGKAAITTMADNHIILRRMSSTIQRYGECDLEEKLQHLYSDENKISTSISASITYNVSLYANVEYSCIVFKANYDKEAIKKPQLRLRRWCAGSLGICFGFGFISIHFYVEILFDQEVNFQVHAYGRTAVIMDPVRVIRLVNKGLEQPHIYTYAQAKAFIKANKYRSLMYNATF